MPSSTGGTSCVITGGVLVAPGREPAPGDLRIENGRIVARTVPGCAGHAETEVDARGLHVLPGVIDPHVHIGLGDGLSEWRSETESAVIGGVTTVLSFLMAGTTYLPLIEEAVHVGEAESLVDFGLHLIPCTPTHLAELPHYVQRGITSFKYFTSFRGDEGAYLGLAGTDDGFMVEFLEQVATYDRAVAAIHPENIEVVWRQRQRLQRADRDDLAAWNESRPPAVEAEATFRALYYAREAGTPVYLVHISSRAAIDEVRVWRERFPEHRVIAETCPQFLTHTSEMSLGSLGKVNPPLRSRSDVEAIWEAVLDGTIDTIGSDHVARTRDRKQGSIWTASAGFPGTATILPVMLSEGYHKRGLPLSRIAELCSANPAKAFGLDPRKGNLDPGADADITLVALARSQRATPDVLHSRSDYSLYETWDLQGWPVATFVRGRLAMRDGAVLGSPGHGRYLPRESSHLPLAANA
jgi:dihydropyrimidinase